MIQIKLSVVMGTMGSPHLGEIIKTFLASAQDVEVIVVIDNPALTRPVAIQDPRLKVILNEVNIGLTRSLNKAIALAEGDIIVRADDDDIPEANRLDELAAFFSKHPRVDLVYSFAKGIDQDTGRAWTIDGSENNEGIQQQLLMRNFIVHSSLAFRRHRLAPLGFYDETFRFAQDYDLYLRAMRAGLVFGCIPKVLVTRLYHKDSITVAKRKRQIVHSMAARLLHAAQVKDDLCVWPVIARYALLLAIPDWVRTLRRRLGHGK